jgi:hypothetical protein
MRSCQPLCESPLLLSPLGAGRHPVRVLSLPARSHHLHQDPPHGLLSAGVQGCVRLFRAGSQGPLHATDGIVGRMSQLAAHLFLPQRGQGKLGQRQVTRLTADVIQDAGHQTGLESQALQKVNFASGLKMRSKPEPISQTVIGQVANQTFVEAIGKPEKYDDRFTFQKVRTPDGKGVGSLTKTARPPTWSRHTSNASNQGSIKPGQGLGDHPPQVDLALGGGGLGQLHRLELFGIGASGDLGGLSLGRGFGTSGLGPRPGGDGHLAPLGVGLDLGRLTLGARGDEHLGLLLLDDRRGLAQRRQLYAGRWRRSNTRAKRDFMLYFPAPTR